MPAMRELVVKTFLLLGVGVLDVTRAQTYYECTFSPPVQLEDGVTLESVKNSEAGTYTMRLTYTGGLGWVGIGINREGSSKMVPSTAIIGRIEFAEDDITPIGSSVLKYDMTTDEKDGSGVVPYPEAVQTLQDAVFEQGENADGIPTSTLTFTHTLVDAGMGQTVADESSWLFAIGLPDNLWEGKHKVHGSFTLPLADGCVQKVVEQPDPEPEPEPAPEPAAPEPVVPDNSTSTADGEGNEGVDEDEDDENIDPSAPIPVPAPVDPVPAPVDPFPAPAPGNSFASSTGDVDRTSTGLVMNEDVAESTFSLWKAHGWTLFVAWAILAPLAVCAAVLKSLLASRPGLWYNIHYYLNVLVVLLTTVGFGLAVAAIRKEGKTNFAPRTSPDDIEQVHHNAGLAIFIIVVVHSFVGYFRPSPAAAPSKDADDAKSSSTAPPSPDQKQLMTGQSASDAQEKGTAGKTIMTGDFAEGSDESDIKKDSATGNEHSVNKDTTSPTPSPPPKKPLLRKVWEVQHRLTGAMLMGLAWYNCHTGYQLMAENYDSSQDHTTAFWSVVGVIGGITFILGYGAKV